MTNRLFVSECSTPRPLRLFKFPPREYGNLRELRAALKLKISQIKLKSQAGPNKLLELFNEVQYLTVKVKAHGGENSLKHDEEYVALLLRHLSDEQ